LANVTPDGCMPFIPVRAFKAASNRWTGVGIVRSCEMAQEFIDRHLNYIAYRNRYHVSAKFVRRDCLEGVDNVNEIACGPDDVFILKPDKTKEEAFGFLELPRS